MQQGIIYVLTNSAMPGVVKVGKTTRDPVERSAQLSSATGVPERFVVYRTFEVSDCDEAERIAHSVLARVFGRPNASREFFAGEPQEVTAFLEEVLRPLVADAGARDALEFDAAIAQVVRKEFTMAWHEFEFLFDRHPPTEERILGSNALMRAAGAYLAACVGAGRPPNFSCVLGSRVRAAVMERAIRHVEEFDSDAAGRVISFVRDAT